MYFRMVSYDARTQFQDIDIIFASFEDKSGHNLAIYICRSDTIAIKLN